MKKTTFTLLSCTTVIFGSSIIGACSGDYDIYADKELKTEAGGVIPSNRESGSESSVQLQKSYAIWLFKIIETLKQLSVNNEQGAI